MATLFDSRFWATQLLSRIGCLLLLTFFMFCSAAPGKFRSRNTQSATPGNCSPFPSNKMLCPFHTALLTVHLIKLWKLKSSGMLLYVLASIIPDVSTDLSAFIFRVTCESKHRASPSLLLWRGAVSRVTAFESRFSKVTVTRRRAAWEHVLCPCKLAPHSLSITTWTRPGKSV